MGVTTMQKKKRKGPGAVVGTVWKRVGGKSVRTTSMMRAGRFTTVHKRKKGFLG